MKKVLIFLVILLGATIDVFSQRAILEADVPKLEKEAIAKIRRTFHIRRSTELLRQLSSCHIIQEETQLWGYLTLTPVRGWKHISAD